MSMLSLNTRRYYHKKKENVNTKISQLLKNINNNLISIS